MKAVLTRIETTGCALCEREPEEYDDSYRLSIGDKEFFLCDTCAPNLCPILTAAGVEVEGLEAPAPIRGRPQPWRV